MPNKGDNFLPQPKFKIGDEVVLGYRVVEHSTRSSGVKDKEGSPGTVRLDDKYAPAFDRGKEVEISTDCGIYLNVGRELATKSAENQCKGPVSQTKDEKNIELDDEQKKDFRGGDEVEIPIDASCNCHIWLPARDASFFGNVTLAFENNADLILVRRRHRWQSHPIAETWRNLD